MKQKLLRREASLSRREGASSLYRQRIDGLDQYVQRGVLEDLVQALEGITKPEALCFLHGQIKLARNFIQMRWKEPGR
jgi:hypothetical protein